MAEEKETNAFLQENKKHEIKKKTEEKVVPLTMIKHITPTLKDIKDEMRKQPGGAKFLDSIVKLKQERNIPSSLELQFIALFLNSLAPSAKDERDRTIIESYSSDTAALVRDLIKAIYDASLRRDKQNQPKLKKSGESLRRPSHSYLVHSSIAKERNQVAAENVFIIVTLIEQAGGSIPRIKASTIIERNIQLAKRMENDPQHKGQFLKRVFSKTWELLKNRTDLIKYYNNIAITTDKSKITEATYLKDLDPKNPTFIPTTTDVDSIVFYFPHKGKK